MSNPLLEQHQLPPFSRIQASQVEPAIRQLIERNKQAIERLLADNERYTWDNLWQPIEELEDELSQAWSPVAHLNGVCNSDALRKAYNACLPLLSEYGTWMGQHQHLYRAYLQISESPEFTALDAARRKALENVLRDFRLAGVALPPEQKARYAELRKRLSELGSRFSDNVLDATNAWSKQVDKEQLRGLPETALASARQAAERAGLEGYLINLEFPSYYPVLTYCDDAGLREEVYRANCTRASDEGPNAGQWDNSALIEETLALRHELARLLGFANYAELSLATKMADTPAQVREFLEQLAQQSRPQAEDEWHSLQAFARDEYGAADVNAWDVIYYSEKLRQQCYQVSQEELRPYLPITRSCRGCSPLWSACTASACGKPPISIATTPTCACSNCARATRSSPASISTCTPGRTSAAARGWTPVGRAACREANCRSRSPTWCAISPRRWATPLPCSATTS